MARREVLAAVRCLLLLGGVIAIDACAEEAVAASGEVLFRQCGACHTLDKGGPDGVGPNLYGVFGRKVAQRKGFPYSKTMKAQSHVWNEEQLDRFLADPAAYAPGTRMAFSGLRDPDERRAVIDYLRNQQR